MQMTVLLEVPKTAVRLCYATRLLGVQQPISWFAQALI